MFAQSGSVPINLERPLPPGEHGLVPEGAAEVTGQSCLCPSFWASCSKEPELVVVSGTSDGLQGN